MALGITVAASSESAACSQTPRHSTAIAGQPAGARG
jgi:hypothetical protein